MGKKKLALFIMVVISLVAAAMPIVHGGSLFEEPLEWFHKTTSSLAKEKVTKLRFYFHVTVIDGNNITNMQVATSTITNKPPAFFGGIQMADNPLTLGPEITSELIGRAEGLSGTASMEEMSLIMVMNFAFTHGKYKGSTLAILGRNVLALPLREMPIVGGTGVFRLARGIITVKTVWFNTTSGNAVVDINVFAVHY